MIKELVVVEGKNDKNKLVEIFKDIDIFITNGSDITNEKIEIIKEISKDRGVILFLDPDGPGKLIRSKIQEKISDAKHAFIEQSKAISKNKKKVGIEHATKEDIISALEGVYEVNEYEETISFEELYSLGFVGVKGSKEKRIMLSKKLNIGAPNGKQLFKRLNMFGINFRMLEEIDYDR